MTDYESSPIRVNEATWTDLQSLPGIGPRRAERLITFRQEVSPLRNTFDLATATGLSLRQAETLAPLIDWHRSQGLQFVGVLPFLVVLLASLWMMASGLSITLEFASPDRLPGGAVLSAGLLLLLGGLLLVTGNLAVARLKQSPSTGVILPRIGVLASIAGTCLIGVWNLIARLGEPAAATINRLNTVNSFLLAILVITLLVYGPAILMRFLVSDYRRAWLRRAQIVYDSSLPLYGFFPLMAMQIEITTGTAEIFAIWTSALLCIAALDLMSLRSPFIESLSGVDQGRLRFLRRDERESPRLPYPRLFAMGTLVVGITVGIEGFYRLFL